MSEHRPHAFDACPSDVTLCDHCDGSESEPWHDDSFGYMATGEREREDCLLCDAEHPSAHVVVWLAHRERRAGRICASHTLVEVIHDLRERLTLSIELEREMSAEATKTPG